MNGLVFWHGTEICIGGEPEVDCICLPISPPKFRKVAHSFDVEIFDLGFLQLFVALLVLSGNGNVFFKFLEDLLKAKLQQGLVKACAFFEDWHFRQLTLLVSFELREDLFKLLHPLQDRQRFPAHYLFEAKHLVDPLSRLPVVLPELLVQSFEGGCQEIFVFRRNNSVLWLNVLNHK